MATTADELIEKVRALLGSQVLDSHTHCGDATVLVPVGGARECLQRLRDDTGLAFNLLIDLTAVDYLGREPRFSTSRRPPTSPRDSATACA